MISRCRAKSWIVQLNEDSKSNKGHSHSISSPVNQRGLKGHVIIYPQKPSELLKMLPPSVETTCSPICIVFVGSVKPSKDWLKKHAHPLIVRRERVHRALLWLQKNNIHYRDVSVDYQTLQQYPENDIIPAHIEVLKSDSVNDATSQYFSDCNVPFDSVVVTDVSASSTSNQMRAAAVKHIKLRNGGFMTVPHGKEPINEFFNPSMFPMIYPTLFPYGIGGFEDENRESVVSLKRHIKHL
ncbi:hypothetical protein BDN70DRAFT_807950, partial [Pholiota conissans]